MACVTSHRQGASAMELQRLLELPSYQTAWVWLHKLRRAMAWEDPFRGSTPEVQTRSKFQTSTLNGPSSPPSTTGVAAASSRCATRTPLRSRCAGSA
jgi:hypothetical protein